MCCLLVTGSQKLGACTRVHVPKRTGWLLGRLAGQGGIPWQAGVLTTSCTCPQGLQVPMFDGGEGGWCGWQAADDDFLHLTYPGAAVAAAAAGGGSPASSQRQRQDGGGSGREEAGGGEACGEGACRGGSPGGSGAGSDEGQRRQLPDREGDGGLTMWRYHWPAPTLASTRCCCPCAAGTLQPSLLPAAAHKQLLACIGVPWAELSCHLSTPPPSPTCPAYAQDELVASGWQLGVPPVVASRAHYGRPQDAPANPTVFAGQEFRWVAARGRAACLPACMAGCMAAAALTVETAAHTSAGRGAGNTV